MCKGRETCVITVKRCKRDHDPKTKGLTEIKGEEIEPRRGKVIGQHFVYAF